MKPRGTSGSSGQRAPTLHPPNHAKIVGYIRVSTDNQVDGYGLESQEQAIQDFAHKNRLGAVRIYAEKGVSGDLEDRPALGSLMMDVKDGKVAKVIVVRLDRLARDLMLQENIIADMAQRDVELISIDEPDLCSKDPTRVLFRQIKGAISEYEKKMIKLRLMAGRMSKAQDGGFVGGRRPLGYKRVHSFNGKKRPDLIVDPISSETIKTILKLRKRGKNLSQIARHLQENGFKTARGGKWYPCTIKYILSNPIYKGRISHNGQFAKRLDLILR